MFAAPLRHVGRVSPAERPPRVVRTIDNAPWHRGPLIAAALAENPHLEFDRQPSASPQLNVIERLWKGGGSGDGPSTTARPTRSPT